MNSETSLKSSCVKCRVLWSVVAILTLVAIGFARPSYKLASFHRFTDKKEHIRAVILRWKYATDATKMRTSNHVYDYNWNGAWDAVNSLVGNGCSVPEDVTFAELERLIVDF